MVTVSTSELDRLGRELQAAAAVILAHAHNDLGVQLAADGPLTAAVGSVERDWSKQRTAITDFLAKLGQGAQAAALLYDSIERQIGQAAAPTPSSATR